MPDDIGYLNKHPVTHIMSVEIIDQLEIVQIHDHKRPLPVPALFGDLFGSAGLIEKACQFVYCYFFCQAFNGLAVYYSIVYPFDQYILIKRLVYEIGGSGPEASPFRFPVVLSRDEYHRDL